MSHISRIASPMSICEEDLFDVDKKVKAKKNLLQQQQNDKPPFLVGTIQKVNSRIRSLYDELSQYESQLAIESEMSNEEPYNDGTMLDVASRPTRSARERQEKEITDFSGLYSTKLFSSQKLPKTHSKKPLTSAQSKKSDAPKLVELQQFPGWNYKRYIPLPHSVEIVNVLDHVIAAQRDSRHKTLPVHRPEFKRLLYSSMQQHILQDSFWWFFLNKYHPDSVSQSRLFERISNNFVRLMLYAESIKYKNLFFLNYGSLLAQSLYSAFCVAFPQSWHQFEDHDFKEMLAQICGEWMSGIRPSPKSFLKWNTSALEPTMMQKKNVMEPKKKRIENDKHRNFGVASPTSIASRTSTTQSGTGSFKTTKLRLTNNSAGKTSAKSLHFADGDATAENSRTPLENSITPNQTLRFSRNVFNIHGRSPLLVQVSRQYNLENKSNRDVYVRHTHLSSHPSHTANIYQDTISESVKRSSTVLNNFKRIYDEDKKAHNLFCIKQKREYDDFQLKAKKLLSKPRQVSYLSKLILMKIQKDQDDMPSGGAAAALQAALAAEAGSK